MKTEIKTAIILGVVIVGIISSLSLGFSSIKNPPSEVLDENTNEESLKTLSIDKSKFKKAPKLAGISGYINSSPETLQNLDLQLY